MDGIIKVPRVNRKQPWYPVGVSIGGGSGEVTLQFPFDPKLYVIHSNKPKVVHLPRGGNKGLFSYSLELADLSSSDIVHLLTICFTKQEEWLGDVVHLTVLEMTDWRIRSQATLIIDRQCQIVPWIQLRANKPDEVYVFYLDQEFSASDFYGVPCLWSPHGQYLDSQADLFKWQQKEFLPKWKRAWKEPTGVLAGFAGMIRRRR
jgi:hypothetical protein